MNRTVILPAIVSLLVSVASPVFALTSLRIEPYAFESPNQMIVSNPEAFNISVTDHSRAN